MNPEEQARKLAEWLDSHPGSDPPVGLDPDVVEAVYALRPDLAPAPRVSADDILAAVTSGPLAAGWTREAAAPQDDDEVRGGAVVPFPTPAPRSESTGNPLRRWAFGAGVGTLLAMAAAALLIVRTIGQQEAAPSPTAMFAVETPTGSATHGVAEDRSRETIAKEKTEEALAPEVADGDFDDNGVDELAHDATTSRDTWRRAGQLGPQGGAAGVVTTPDATVAFDGVKDVEDAKEEAPADAPMVVATGSPSLGFQSELAAPTARATATPAELPAPPLAVAAKPAREPVTTLDESSASGPAVADVGDDEVAGAVRSDTVRNTEGLEQSVGATTGTLAGGDAYGGRTLDMEDEAQVETKARPGSRPAMEQRDRSSAKPEATDTVSEVVVAESRSAPTHREQEHREKDRISGESQAAAESPPVEVDAAAAAPPPASDLDALRARAVPADLPRSELLGRSGTAANLDANELGAEGRYVEAGNALLPTVTLPAPQGSTNAAQAATWYLAAPDPGLARTAAEAGLANTSGNTPERSWLWVLYGDALRQAGDASGAARAYGEAVQLNDSRLAGPETVPAAEPPGR